MSERNTEAQRFQRALDDLLVAGKECIAAVEHDDHARLVLALYCMDAAQKALEAERHPMVACLLQCRKLDRLLNEGEALDGG